MTEQLRTSLKELRGLLIIAVAMASFGGGAAIAAMSEDRGGGEPAHWDEGLAWQSVAQGRDANFGGYELFRATAGQKDCFGISLPDNDPPGVARAIAASCVEDPTLQVSFVRGSAGTLAYGRANADTRSVTLTGNGSEPRQARLIDGPSGTRYFVASMRGRAEARVRSSDGNGRTIAERSVPE